MPEQYQAHTNPVLWRVRRRDGGALIQREGRAGPVMAVEKQGRLAYDVWREHCHEWGNAPFAELQFEVVK